MTHGHRLSVASTFLLVLACGPRKTPDQVTPPDSPAAPEAEPTQALGDDEGGRLFDKWAASPSYEGDFKAGSAGGPNGNGTLNGADDQPMSNDGHDYRLKNFFGWDLKGAEGIYGEAYQNKPHALPVNLLTDTRSADELATWILEGGDGLPAYSAVLDASQAAAIAAFVVGVRDRSLPHPDQIWTLSKDAPNNYVLNEGGDAAAGAAFIKDSCGCHGGDGNGMAIEGSYSLGSYGRMKAHEAWIKIVNGQPGTAMGRQTTDAATVLNVLAALCDRTAFPPRDAEHEVKDGDARCGPYLK